MEGKLQMPNLSQVRPPVKLRPSPQQTAVVERAMNGDGNIFVEAVAGSGKTSLLIMLMRALKGSVAMMAYNRPAADELKERAGATRANINTVHGMGYRPLREAFGAKVNEREKTFRMWDELELQGDLRGFVSKLLGLAKNNLLTPDDDEAEWLALVDHHDLAYALESESMLGAGVRAAMKALPWSIQVARDDGLIDFDDMLYLPVHLGMAVPQFDWVLGDEWQDANKARHELARMMVSGRAVFVGDRHQAIYGFTGADAQAVDNVIRDFRCVEMPLTVSYRCPKAVVREAQQVVGHIQAHEDAPEGTVRGIEAELLEGERLGPRDAILCRKTQPLVDAAFRFIRQGIGCHVEGREIGTGLIKLVDRWKSVDTLADLERRLEQWSARETEKLMAKRMETAAAALRDKVLTLETLMANVDTVGGLRAKINDMFVDEKGAKKTLTLSTVHKAKGREWDRVFLLGRNAWMPSPWAKQDWQFEQEQNLIYVGITRSKDELVYASVPDKRNGGG